MSSKQKDLYTLEYEILDNSDNTKELTIYWAFPNFSSQIENPGNRDICTNKNELADIDDDYKFQLRIKILGTNRNLIEFYYMIPKRPLSLKYTLFMTPRSYPSQQLASNEKFMWCPANKWIFCVDQYNIDYKNSKVEFELQCTIDPSDKSENNTEDCESKCTLDIPRINEAKLNLHCDLANLLNRPMFSDLTIKSNEGEQILAHKGILAARSPVLQAHFNHNMAESLTNVIECPFETEVLKAILKFIYTADTLQLYEIPAELYKAADFYQIGELKNFCKEVLKEKLTVENVIKTLEFADLYSDGDLKRTCLEFININDSKLIKKTEGWKQIKSLDIFKSIAEYNIDYKYN